MPRYFSYGSNMDAPHLVSRCPGTALLGVASLRDYELSFTLFSQTRQCGCPDILKKPGAAVWGALYTVTAADLLLLDGYEGVAREKYRRLTVSVFDPSGISVETETYEVVHKAPDFQKPSKVFLAQLTISAARLAFPVSYQNFLNATPTCD
jgi:gamma-glutamylcyclotransferase (GGCT)/AIG2-like uncharacterized protein YtfP